MSGSTTQRAGDLLDSYLQLLHDHRNVTAHDPQNNPVKLLAYDMSRDIEAGQVSLDDLAAMSKSLSDTALIARARRLAGYLPFSTEDAALDAFEARLREQAKDGSGTPLAFAEFSRLVGEPIYGLVLTAHPTFSTSREMRHLIADIAAGAAGESEIAERLANLAHHPDDVITLATEHGDAQEALGHLQQALHALNRRVLKVAREIYPGEWMMLTPKLATLASWVGYDLDGRVDIEWWHSVRFRLREKSTQLTRYALSASMVKLGAGAPAEFADAIERLRRRLAAAAVVAREDAEAFEADLTSAETFMAAANKLTNGDARRLVTAVPLLAEIEAAIAFADNDGIKEQLILLMSDIALLGFGTGHIHLRINAAQVQNALRVELDWSEGRSLEGRLALEELDNLIKDVTVQSINFGSVHLERTTARRQIMLVAQILKHIDADVPIRFLIAECEEPITLLGMVYFARQFGVADRIDISPLFETPAALQRGGRLIAQMLDMPIFLDYARERGRFAIQTGFSDAGRFIGQISATLAVERLQILLARALKERGIFDVEALVFNTHGESLGRGAHPGGLRARLLYLLSPWARSCFAKAGIRLKHETSFQGGDGFVFFARGDLATITLAGLLIVEHERHDMMQDDDPFYDNIAFSWDFYASLVDYHQDLFADENYAGALSVFGPNLLHKTGSRETKRQFDSGKRGLRPDLGLIRAIPHNAILQQIGYPANVVAGVGSFARLEFERLAELGRTSKRAASLLQMVAFAKRQSSLTALGAYGNALNAGFWVARAYTGGADERVDACLTVADLLTGRERYTMFARLLHQLRKDALFLHRLLDEIGLDGGQDGDEQRQVIYLLHAIRIALIMHLFVLAARLPNFSSRNDFSRDSLLDLILSLRVPEAVQVLKETFPLVDQAAGGFELSEPADLAIGLAHGYPQIHTRYIQPMEKMYSLMRDIGVGLSHNFGAYG